MLPLEFSFFSKKNTWKQKKIQVQITIFSGEIWLGMGIFLSCSPWVRPWEYVSSIVHIGYLRYFDYKLSIYFLHSHCGSFTNIT